MKSNNERAMYSPATASLLRRTAAQLTLAAATPEGVLPRLPERIEFVLDKVITGLADCRKSGDATITCHSAEKEQVLSMASRIYNLLPLYLGSTTAGESRYFTLLIAHNLSDLAAYYSSAYREIAQGSSLVPA